NGMRWIYDLMLGGVLGRPLGHNLVDTKPLRDLMEQVYRPEVVRQALISGQLKNVAVSATEVYSGSLVTFIQSLEKKSWQRARRRSENTNLDVGHFMASAAIPLLFPSVLVNNRRYVDGCIRSTSPLGPATRLGAEKILAIGVRRYYMRETGNFHELTNMAPEPKPSMAQLGALVLNSLFAESLDADVEHLERLNAILPLQREGSFGMRQVESLVIRPSEDLGEMAKHFTKEMPPLVRFLLRGMGSERGKSSDMLSYLLFVPGYLSTLVDLGYADARADDSRLRKFLLD
ncbi:MAG: patatin-like phospholipase family protein, partial [Bdellovibrionota bacterium]